ncbi:hypothetical protein Cs7R123_03170 [Catellatospora sp. TT07R-123]|nr:hypothetical protein Cs7R123_03170 [Catellatospora sp. TT07R-123]
MFSTAESETFSLMRPERTTEAMMSGTSTFHIDGMTCGRCVEAVRVKVAAVAGVAAAGYTLA